MMMILKNFVPKVVNCINFNRISIDVAKIWNFEIAL